MNSILRVVRVTALVDECHHIKPSMLHAGSFCFGVALFFVGSLYIFVPAHVRLLDRDDPLQIQWRAFATGMACIASIISYPYIFCDDPSQLMGSNNESVLELIGITSNGSPWNIIGPLFHTVILYTGPISMLLLRIYLISEGSNKLPLAQVSYAVLLQPLVSTIMQSHARVDRWIFIRNILAAPIIEEIVFRGCVVPPLLRTGRLHPMAVAWLSPLFFGLAHCHHALLKLKQKHPVTQVVLSTTFQFMYTTLFGAYAAFAFIRSRSIIAVILSHSFCNSMGLPTFIFLNKTCSLYPFRVVLMISHIVGIIAFVWGFQTDIFLPFPGSEVPR